jgi:hypothetical protein
MCLICNFIFSNIFIAIIPSQLTAERLTFAPFSSIHELLLSDFNIYSTDAMRQQMLVIDHEFYKNIHN